MQEESSVVVYVEENHACGGFVFLLRSAMCTLASNGFVRVKKSGGCVRFFFLYIYIIKKMRYICKKIPKARVYK